MKELHYSLLNAEDIYSYGKSIAALVAKFGDDPFVQKILPLLQKAIDNMALAFGRSERSEFTKILQEHDDARDEAFLAFRDLVLSASRQRKNAARQEAARKVLAHLRQQGMSLHNQGYAAQTARLNALLAALDEADGQNAIAMIGVGDLLSELQAAQAAFEETYQQKADAEAKKNYPLILENRPKVERYVSGLLSYLDLQAEVDPANYQDVVHAVDVIITETMTTVSARQTRRETALAEEKATATKTASE